MDYHDGDYEEEQLYFQADRYEEENKFSWLMATLVWEMRQRLIDTVDALTFSVEDDAVYVYLNAECICSLDLEHIDILKAAYEELTNEQTKRTRSQNLG